MTHKTTMPEPVGYQWLDTGHFRKKVPVGSDVSTFNPLITTTQAEAYANAMVKQALEEAANKVADPINIEASIENFSWVSHGNYVRAHLILRDAVEAIRALIPKENT